MKYNESIIGHTYGELTVLSLHSNVKYKKKYRCECSCGHMTIVGMSNLRNGKTKSCGCLRAKFNIKTRRTHGESKSKLYGVWCTMKARCLNTTNSNYDRYGGRGIGVCDQWLASYTSFRSWALNTGYKDGLSIDREDNDGDYTPENCRWATYTIQSINKRVSSCNTSGYVGVNKHGKRWCARLTVEGVRVQIGTYDTKELAHKARCEYIENNNLAEHRRALKYE